LAPCPARAGPGAKAPTPPEQTRRKRSWRGALPPATAPPSPPPYDRYEQRIFTFCHRLTGSADDAADATQDAFVSMLERLPSLEDRDLNFGAYLFTTARHSAYRVMERRRRAEPVDELPERGASGGGFGPGWDPDDGGDASNHP
jgi:hypothetical protein